MWVLFYPKFRDLKDVLRIQSNIYHIVGKNGKTANLKTGFPRKQSTPNFPKNEQFLPPWYAYVRVFASASSLEIITSFEMSFKRLSWGLFTLQDLPNFCFFKKRDDFRFQYDCFIFTNLYWITVWKLFKYWVFSGLYFPVFGLDTET